MATPRTQAQVDLAALTTEYLKTKDPKTKRKIDWLRAYINKQWPT